MFMLMHVMLQCLTSYHIQSLYHRLYEYPYAVPQAHTHTFCIHVYYRWLGYWIAVDKVYINHICCYDLQMNHDIPFM